MSLDYKTDSALQKRLHDELSVLVTLPHNNVCCDCGAITPKWASVNLGVFICIRCAGIHRSIGTHITKVRSITLDSWTEEQVEVMRKVGNLNAQKIWENNTNVQKKPDMEQHRLERYIRDKYEKKRFFNQQMYDDVFAGKFRVSGSQNPSAQNVQSQNNANTQNYNENESYENSASKQLHFMPPSKFGNQKRNSQPADAFGFNQNTFNNQNGFNNQNNFNSQNVQQMPRQQMQQSKSADIFDFGPDIEFQDSYEVQQPKPQNNTNNMNNMNTFTQQKSGNVFDFLDSSEVQSIPQNSQNGSNSSRPIQRKNVTPNVTQNVTQTAQQTAPKYQKKSDILFSQPQQQQQTNIFDTMGGMSGMSQPQQQQFTNMPYTQKAFDFMALYQQPQRPMQQNYGGMQQNGMYGQMGQQNGQMYGQQQMYGQGMQMQQRDYSSIGKYYM